ncbi:MAG: haloacid dehalogenase type II [Wenzhouxiangellaceae bacterium]|nr:haloacid dehalogenase type II [Wenzhouxiangellaceae bacterium]
MTQSASRPILAFDIYGTLIDTDGVLDQLRGLVGDSAAAVSATWRDKQLEYAFRRGLMKTYRPFPVCTADALDYSLAAHGLALDRHARERLLAVYRELPAFDDARAALDELNAAGYRCFAFSNGTRDAVAGLLEHARIDAAFEGIVSCDEVSSFKPDPMVYAHLLQVADVAADAAWLVSGNPFDVIGARAAGLHAAWINRADAKVFDPWEFAPDATIGALTELPAVLAAVAA